MVEWISTATPLISTLGGAGASVFLFVLIYRFQKDFVGHYSDELDKLRDKHAMEVGRLNERIAELAAHVEAQAETIRSLRESQVDWVREREAMRIAMRVNGVPWNPEDWNQP